MSPTTLAIIPARGGSKGIPRKNLKDLAGKPLLAWTIEQALATPGLDVYVSTEDAEIAAVSRTAGAGVIERPDELAQDTTATEPVVEHAIDALASHLPASSSRHDGARLETVRILRRRFHGGRRSRADLHLAEGTEGRRTLPIPEPSTSPRHDT